MKKNFNLISIIVVILLCGMNAYASTDCIYSGEYTCDSSFEASTTVDYELRDRWMGYYSSTMVDAQIVTDSNYVYEGSKAVKFSNVKGKNNRGLYYRTYHDEFIFKAGDVIEMSGWFKTDAATANIAFAVGETSMANQNITSISRGQWYYIKGQYTVTEDGEVSGFRINTNLHTNEGYVYADNLSIKRMKNTSANNRIKKIATKNGIYAAIDDNANLWMWGQGEHFELNNKNTQVDVPTIMQTNVADVCLGDGHVVILTKSGNVLAWGRNDYGQLGNNITKDTAIPVTIATNAKAIAAGDYHTIYINKYGNVFGMGQNYSSTFLASGGYIVLEPVQIEFKSMKAENVWASKGHTFVRTSDGNLNAIGYNGNSQLGTDSFNPETKYLQIAENVIDVECSEDYTVYTDNNGKMYASGLGKYGQFAESDAYSTFTKLENVVSDFAAGKYTLYTKIGNILYGTGGTQYGMVGDNASMKSQIATNVLSVDADEKYMYTVNNNIIVTSDGNVDLFTIAEPEAKNEFVFDLNGKPVYNINSNTAGSTMVIASYFNDEMQNVTYFPNISAGENVVSAPRVDGAEYRIFLWDSLSGMNPVDKPKLFNLATISMTSVEEDGKYKLRIKGRTAEIDSVSQGKDVITFYAYNKDAAAPTLENIKAIKQFSSNDNGTFDVTVPMNENPQNCKLKIKISGEVIEKEIN